MRLGLVMAGVGVHGAACIGVMQELARRQIEPYAVCGMGGGAWPAALFGAGWSVAQMVQAAEQMARASGRMLRPGASARALLKGKGAALGNGRTIQRLLRAQTGERLLAMCPGRAVFPLRSAHSGSSVVFSTKSFEALPGTILTLQASLAFAAFAAMAVPPIFSPAEWMGSPLLPETDLRAAVMQLQAMGAQRVLAVLPIPSVQRQYDVLELVSLIGCGKGAETVEDTGVLRVPMPANVGALKLTGAMDCVASGRVAAERGIDLIFEQMGMAHCRVLPFRRRG